MTAIPEGGWAEVEWGVRHETAGESRVVAASQEDAREQVSWPHTPDCVMTLVAREVIYGPWLECKS